MAGHIRRMAGGGKARSDAAKRLLEILSRPESLTDVFPLDRFGEGLQSIRQKTRDSGKEHMLLRRDDDPDTLYGFQGDRNSISLPSQFFPLFKDSVSIHTHPAGSPQPSYQDMRLWGHPQTGAGQHDLLTFGMPEGARIGDSDVRMAPALYGVTRLHRARPDGDPVGRYSDYSDDVQRAQAIWNDDRRMRTIARDLPSNEITDETVKKVPFLHYLDQNPDAASGYWRDNSDTRKDEVTLSSIIDSYLYGKGKYWKRGGHLRSTTIDKGRH